jgi:hypothetical protein
MVEKTVGRWRAPVRSTALWAWVEYMDIVAQERNFEAMEEARKELSGVAELEKDQLMQLVEAEKSRRMHQAKQIVLRILHSQLAGAFDCFVNRVFELKDRRERCQRVVFRLLHTHLAAAFDLFRESVDQLKTHREVVQKAMSRWRTPMLAVFWDLWLEATEESKERLHTAAQQEAMRELKQNLELERDTNLSLAEREAERHRLFCQRTVKRMLHIQLATAFDEYVDRVAEVKRKRETGRRVIYRILHTHLAAAFDGFAAAVSQLVQHRQMVYKAMSRWRHPVLPVFFERWVDHTDEVRLEAIEEGHALAKQALNEQIEAGKSAAEHEAERRLATCKRTVQRMLHIQLAIAFDSFRDRLEEVRERRARCKQVVLRMLHTQLAAAFGCFADAVRLLTLHRNTVQKAIGRWRVPVLVHAWGVWVDAVDDSRAAADAESQQLARETLTAAAAEREQRLRTEAADEREEHQALIRRELGRRLDMCRKTIARMMHIQLANAFDTFFERVQDKRDRTQRCKRVVQRMMQRELVQAFERLVEATRQLRVQRSMIASTLARWKTPLLAWVFCEWSDFVDVIKAECAEKAHELAKQELAARVDTETQRGEDCVRREAERRLRICSSAIKRMFHIQLAIAFDSLRERVAELRDNKARCRQVVRRMLHSNLAGAFDGFVLAMECLRAHRELVAKAIARWQAPSKHMGFMLWLEYMEVVRLQRKEEAQDVARRRLVEELEESQSKYAHLPVAVSLTFDLDFDTTLACPETAREFDRRVQADVSTALCIPASAVEVMCYQRGSVIAEVVLSKVEGASVSDIRTGALLAHELASIINDKAQPPPGGMVGGGAGGNLFAMAHKAEIDGPIAEPVCQLVTNALRARGAEVHRELVQVSEALKSRVNEVAARHVETCKHVVRRLLHRQLAAAFDAYFVRVLEVKEQRARSRRVVARIMHRQLAVAFDGLCAAVIELVRHRRLVMRAVARWQAPLLQIGWERWREYGVLVKRESRDAAYVVAQQQLASLLDGERSMYTALIEKETARRMDLCRKTVWSPGSRV